VLDELEQARETNKRLNRRLQKLEGPRERDIAKANRDRDDWFAQWRYANQIRIERENHIVFLWLYAILLSVAFTAYVLWHWI